VDAGPNLLQRRTHLLRQRAAQLSPNTRAMAWSIASSFLFVLLNSLMRELTMQMHAYEVQFLRYLMGLLVMLPLMLRAGLATYRPKNIVGQFTRGAVHTVGLILWFIAITHITIADTTAIGFTTPIFIMLGAVLVFKEPMRWERWLAAAIGFAGVLIVVAPKLTGQGGWYSLVMLAASPVFATSFLITKALTRYERAEVIVAWQAISITVLSLPLALLHWSWPAPGQWLLFVLCGLLGSSAHYCLTRSYAAADISATQSVRFLELVWATLLGWIVFGDGVSTSTLMGGVVICASTLWIARRESRGPR
jgi:drug/metabolite transporter (DMT)-like permease